MKLLRRLLPLAVVPLLAACVDDSASYQISSRENALTLIRQQKWFWDKKVDVALVVSRLPDCQRRHPLGTASPQAKFEIWQPGPGTFIVRQGDKLYLTETQTCEGWQKLDAEPPGGLGQAIGTFQEENGKLSFVPAAGK